VAVFVGDIDYLGARGIVSGGASTCSYPRISNAALHALHAGSWLAGMSSRIHARFCLAGMSSRTHGDDGPGGNDNWNNQQDPENSGNEGDGDYQGRPPQPRQYSKSTGRFVVIPGQHTLLVVADDLRDPRLPRSKIEVRQLA
jgi:hypothetical protein